MRCGDAFQLCFCFRQSDVHNTLAQAHTFYQKLQGDGCLACSRASFHKVQPTARESTAQDIIQTRNTGLRQVIGLFACKGV